MRKTKEQRFKFNIKNNKGITLVSLVITIAVMLIIASITVNTSMGRFEINRYKKLLNDLELLQDKVESYYLQYGGLPILRDDETNDAIPYDATLLDFDRNSNDSVNYYILDLKAMDNLALNYGKGFANYNNPDEKDLYVINEGSHTIYYVEGVELSGITYHYIKENEQIAQIDNIPPTKPKINIISGTKNDEGIYTSKVELELIAGKDILSGVEKTTYLIKDDEGTTIAEGIIEESIIYSLTETGIYTITMETYDNKGYSSDRIVSLEIVISMPVATVGTKVTENSTIDGKKYSSTNPIIPAGFAPINIIGEHASSWDKQDGPEVNKGLVITDNTTLRDEYGNTIGNEFVWIPVSKADFSLFAVPQSEGSKNYKAILNITDTTYKEPADLTSRKTWNTATIVNEKEVAAGTSYVYDGTDMFNLFDMGSYSTTYYQNKFNDMVNSVKEYGGFYVGRYESSLEGTKAQSKSGQSTMSGIEWYRMYKSSEAYSQSGVISEMIWGCQWDAMLRLIAKGPQSSHVTEATNVAHASADFTTKPYATGGTDYSTNYKKTSEEEGYVAYNDIASNIYDIEGNVFEITQEAYSTHRRVRRGGFYNNGLSPNDRSIADPTDKGVSNGSRLTLYVEL